MPHRKFIYFLSLLSLFMTSVALAQDPDQQLTPPWLVRKIGVDMDVRSMGRILADEMVEAGGVKVLSPDEVGPMQGMPVESEVELRGPNVQVNDPALDSIQIFPGFRPFMHFTESETSIAAHGHAIVATYNSSAGLHLSPAPSPPAPPGSLVVDRTNLSAFSVSNDGGRSWRSGFMPGAAPGAATFGDPAVSVDREGNFFFSGLGNNATGQFAIVVNKSTDGGQTWSPAVVVQQDNGADKPWSTVGPEPTERRHDEDNEHRHDRDKGGDSDEHRHDRDKGGDSDEHRHDRDKGGDSDEHRHDRDKGGDSDERRHDGDKGGDSDERRHDNVYVTWTSFQPTGLQLRFGRSTDGGQTWTSKTIFAPTPDPIQTNPQNALQFSVPVVDPETGRLYIAFMHFSNSDQDFLRLLISDDAGETFRFATFNTPGAPLPTVLPVTQSGELTECGATIVRLPGSPPTLNINARLTIHAGPPTTVGTIPGFPLRRFISAARLVTQPALAARNGVVYLAWSNSTSTTFGDPNAGSNIFFVRSDDGGESWTAPVQVNSSVSNDVHHVLPSLAIDDDPEHVHTLYYTQHADGSVDVDLANSEDHGDSFPPELNARATSTSFTLAPTNIPLPTATQPFATTNYDRQIATCYSLGEYLSVTSTNGKVHALWGDERNTVTQPTNALDPISGQKHSQQDVFFQTAKVE